jgi:hypothetical protein
LISASVAVEGGIGIEFEDSESRSGSVSSEFFKDGSEIVAAVDGVSEGFGEASDAVGEGEMIFRVGGACGPDDEAEVMFEVVDMVVTVRLLLVRL